jgi:GH24 family phage-related lysozyme (muramidase)
MKSKNRKTLASKALIYFTFNLGIAAKVMQLAKVLTERICSQELWKCWAESEGCQFGLVVRKDTRSIIVCDHLLLHSLKQ